MRFYELWPAHIHHQQWHDTIIVSSLHTIHPAAATTNKMLRSLLCLLCIVFTITNAESNNQSATNRDTKRRYLSCNWKCTIQTSNRADELCDDINRMWNSLSEAEKEKVALCVHPPYVFIDRVRRRLHREIGVGSQVREREKYSTLWIHSIHTLTSMLLKGCICIEGIWCAGSEYRQHRNRRSDHASIVGMRFCLVGTFR